MQIIMKQYRYRLTSVILLLLFYHKVFGLIAIEKIVNRPPKEKDIGLIFDVTVINSDSDKKEMLEYSIRSDGTCTINTSSTMSVDNMGRIVGGEFGFIEAGFTDTVSLIWPTVSLFNRVGYCPIVVISTNAKNDEFHLKQLIPFDTRFNSLDPEGRTYKTYKDFRDCQNWDLDYFKNCTPVNCEERYFGIRSYYNVTSQSCEEIPKCSDTSSYYDHYSNECVDIEHLITDEDLCDIREGKYDNNILELHPNTKGKKFPVMVMDKPLDTKNTFANFFGHDFYKRAAIESHKIPEINQIEQSIETRNALWLKGLGDGLLIVFATIAIYVFICFAIFLVVTWLTNRPCTERDGTKRPILQSPVSSGINVYTPSSIMSQR